MTRTCIVLAVVVVLSLAYAAPAVACGYPCSCPSVTGATIDPPDGNGNFRVVIHSTTANQFHVYFRGGMTLVRADQNRTVHLSVRCMTAPSELRIAPQNCAGDEYPTGHWVTTISPASQPPSISLTVDKAYDPDAQRIRRKGVVSWNFGPATDYTSRLARVDLLPWKTADGQTEAGRELWKATIDSVSPPSGTQTFFFDPPRGGQQLTARALIQSCTGSDKQDVAVECAPCDETATPDPVYFNDGNVQVHDSDPLPAIAGQTLARNYNSDEQVVALFGRGWTSVFDRRLIVNPDGSESILSLVGETNAVVNFRGAGGNFRQTWPQSRSAASQLRDGTEAGTYVFRAAGSADAAVYRASDGRLIELRDLRTGRSATISYDAAGLPQTITDSWSGVAWNLTTDPTRRLVTSIRVSSRPELVWTYTYDAAGNLTTVHAPGPAVWRTYEYSNNRMTASRDALGNLVESHTYDANGYGISSTGPSDEIESIQYGITTQNPDERITRVTAKNGNVTDYVLRPTGGSWRTVRVLNGCGSCGMRDMSLARDAKGRVVRRQHAGGYITTYTYAAKERVIDGGDSDAGGGEIRTTDGVERLVSMQSAMKPAGCDPETTQCVQNPTALATIALEPTAATLTTSYEYGDPNWPERVTATTTESIGVVGQLRREETLYHSLTGEVVARSVYGWAPGAGPEDRDGGSAGAPVRINRTVTTRFYGDGAEDSDDGGGAPLAPAFTPGGNFAAAWLALPQPQRWRRSIDGPRTDVADITSFVHYPIDASVPANLRGKLAATRNAAGHITRFEGYDVFGNVTRTVDPNGVATEMTYDILGRLETSTLKGIAGCDTTADPLCATDLATIRTYNPPAGPLQREQSPNGGSTSYTYDARGRVATVSRGPSATDLRERIEYTYDAATGQKSVERILGFESGTWVEKTREAYTYDALRQLQSVVHADSTSVAYTYDREGRVATVRDENHASPNTSYTYDPAGRVSKVVQTLSTATGGLATTRYAYDRHGNLTAVTDPNGNVTTYTYDDFGQLVSQQSPVTGTSTYQYDGTGNLSTMLAANGAVTQRTYDALSRPFSATSTHGAQSETVTWSYDAPTAGTFAIGRLSAMTDPTGSTSFSYERRGGIREEAKTIGAATYTTRFHYEAGGNRSLIRYPSGRTAQYTFDFANRPQTASLDATSLVTAASYLPFGPMRELVFGNGTTRTMQYDSRYRMTTNTFTGGVASIASYSYGYDAAANITHIDDLLDASFDRDFGYDDLNRLTVADGGAGLWGQGRYTYDAMGNMTSSRLGNHTRAFTYMATTPKLASMREGETVNGVSYDAAGNETVYGSNVSAYTPRNHLAAYAGATYGYDGRGIRTVTRRALAVAGLAVSPTVVSGGQQAQGIITLSSTAPAEGAVVTLTANGALVSIPASVTIASGQQSATFTINTQQPEQQTSVTITASFNGAVLARSLTITRPELDKLSLRPSSLAGGAPAVVTVTLSVPALAGGVTVPLASDNAAASVPSHVVVAAGATSASATITTTAVSQQTTATISATVEGVAVQASLIIQPPGISVLSFSPDVLYGGSTTNGTVTLNGPAPAGGSTVLLATEADPLTLPSQVVVAAAQQSATFIVGVAPVERETRARVNASRGESLFEAVITIRPPQLLVFEASPLVVVGGESASAQTILNAPAAAEGARVEIISSDPAAIPSPPAIVVPGGSESAAAALPTLPVTEATPVVVSAMRDGVTRSTTIIVAPSSSVALESFTITPSRVTEGGTATGIVTLTGAAPAGGAVVAIEARQRNMVIVPASVTIPESATSAQFVIAAAEGQRRREKTMEMVASYNSVSATANLTVVPRSSADRSPRPVATCASLALVPCLTITALGPIAPSVVPETTTYNLYTPELNLLAETAASSASAPPIAHEYIWFAGQPLAQVENATGAISWYFNDHLCTPMLQTDAAKRIVWQVEYEPYGSVHAFRRGEGRHQPLRFPGQEATASDVAYNVFRQYRSTTGRYTQSDPLGVIAGTNLYAYAAADPLQRTDRLGLVADPAVGTISFVAEKLAHLLDNFFEDMQQRRVDGHNRFPDEQNSAMRHCTISCEAAQVWGKPLVRFAGGANEIQGFVRWDILRIWSRITGKSPWAFQFDDLADNEKGFGCVDLLKSAKAQQCSTCEECCADKCCSGKGAW